MTAPDQTFQDFEFTHSNRGIHTFIMLNIAASTTWFADLPTTVPRTEFLNCSHQVALGFELFSSGIADQSNCLKFRQ